MGITDSRDLDAELSTPHSKGEAKRITPRYGQLLMIDGPLRPILGAGFVSPLLHPPLPVAPLNKPKP